jgi:membrane associated rhomboid family serine protease
MSRVPARDNPVWVSLRPTPTLLAIIGAWFGIFLLVRFTGWGAFVLAHLVLTPALALGPEPWQLITSGMVHLRFGAVLSSAVGLWLFGTQVEYNLGRNRFLQIVFGSLFFGALTVAVVGRIVAPYGLLFMGARPATMGMLAAYAVLYAGVPMSIFGGTRPISGAWLALVFIGIDVLIDLTDGNWAQLLAGVGAALFGWLFMRRRRGGGLRTLLDRLHLWRTRRRYRVISGGRDTKRYLN